MEGIDESLLDKPAPADSTTESSYSYVSLFMDSVPTMIAVSMKVIIMSINLHYTDGPVMTAGLGLSMVLIHSLGGSLITGFNSGCSNFVSRAFGANNYSQFNRFLIQGLASLMLLAAVFTLLGFYSE